MKKSVRISALLLALVLLAGCGATAEVRTDNHGDYYLTAAMEEGVKSEIDTITDAFSAALAGKDASKITGHLDKSIEVTEDELNTFFAEVTADNAKYEIFDTYYVDGVKYSDVSTRIKKSEGADEYIMVTPGSDEICAVLFVSDDADVSRMITLLIAEVSGGKKIVWIDTSDYKYYGKNAPEYYELSKKAREDGREYSAYIYAQMMYGIIRPGNIYHYTETDEMEDYAHEISAWGQDKFPLEAGGRKIHAFNTELEDSAVVPLVLYRTDVDINSDEFEADAKALKDAFVEKYPYIAEDFDKIVVRGTNADPQASSEQFESRKVVFDLK